METISTSSALITNMSTNSVSLLDLINLTSDVASLNAVYLGISVSAVLVLAGILLGVFYFFNLKPLQEKIAKQEERIEVQKKETDQVLKSAEVKREQSLEDFRDEYKKDVNELLDKHSETNTLETKNQIAGAEKELLEKMESRLEDKNIKLREIILSETVNKINITEKSTNALIDKLQKDLTKEISSMKTKMFSLESKAFDLRRSLVEFEIEHHLKKGQIGALRKMIEKLEMDIEKKWGEEETILEIKDYIVEKGMPSYYLDDLSKVINTVPKKLETIAAEVLKLAQEKIYNLQD